jgi:SAM-dependent methyltransferase
MATETLENWSAGDAYERYVGRWSRRVAREFLHSLALPDGLAWLDVGCATGQLTEVVLAECDPRTVVGLDSSAAFVSQARRAVGAAGVSFEVGDATGLPFESDSFDVAVSGLVLNFVRDPLAMVREMARTTKPAGRVAAYVWDYGGGMQMMRHFWDVAVALNPTDANLDQAERFPLCQPEPLRSLFERAELRSVAVAAIEIPTCFREFDDYWTPFLGRQGAAPTYLGRLDDAAQVRIRETLRSRLAPRGGPIELTARAWWVQGTV